MIGMMTQNMFQLAQIFIVAIYAVYWIGILIPFLLGVSYLIVSRSAKAIKETVRLQSTSKSPLLSYLGETINGASSIRAFNRSEEFIEGFHALLDTNILAVQM
jgi:ABC-type multidrug transport system fused ATPase/permease subunit